MTFYYALVALNGKTEKCSYSAARMWSAAAGFIAEGCTVTIEPW